jgi:hypothetical protein|tara:strand:+ start:7965 stop:8192 length:228 start_codon:yes stop_codon:yes gene_type:complete
MKSRDFVIWLEGYLTGKEKLHFDDINIIHQKISEVVLDDEKKVMMISERPPTNPIVIKVPEIDSDFPGKPTTIYM